MNITIHDLMTKQVLTLEPHHTVEHAKKIMEKNKVHCLPVVNDENNPVGIVTAADLAGHDLKAGTPIKHVMTERVYCLPEYNKVEIAARVMRKHKIHHVVVTHEKEIVGVISSMDLLKLVEDGKASKKKAGNKK